jgi:hypothetical protein
LFQSKKKLEQEVSGLKKDIEDLELSVQKVRVYVRTSQIPECAIALSETEH